MIMELLIPPPLHLFLGLGNRIFDKLHEETMILKAMGLMNRMAYQWAHASPRCMLVLKFIKPLISIDFL